MKHEKRKLIKKKKDMENFVIEIPEEHKGEFVDLICIGGNYKEYVDDPENPGEMIPNPVLKLGFAKDHVETVVFKYAQGQKHRKNEITLQNAQKELANNESSLDVFLKKGKK